MLLLHVEKSQVDVPTHALSTENEVGLFQLDERGVSRSDVKPSWSTGLLVFLVSDALVKRVRFQSFGSGQVVCPRRRLPSWFFVAS